MPSPLSITEHYVRTPDGWSLHLRRTVSPEHFQANTQPLLVVPGYGMNNFIFGYHPRDTSMERCLAEGGFEVWSFNLRGHGDSQPTGKRAGPITLKAYATQDVPALVNHVLGATRTTASSLVLIGASLGGTVAYLYLALTDNAPVSALITMGSPLRWSEVHPLVKAVFASPRLAGAVTIKGSRRLLQGLLPALRKAPSLLGIYMNTATIDMQHIRELTRTVEDPLPSINRELAIWLATRDLIIDGVNLTSAVGHVMLPLLVVLANRDGVVPPATTLSATAAWGGPVEVLQVGDERNWYAHANLFIANDAKQLVFEPMIAWLRSRSASG